MDTLEDFPRSLRLHRKGVPWWWWWSPPREVSAFWVVEGRKEPGRVRRRRECQPASSLTSLSTSCYLCASSVSKQGFQRESMSVCVRELFHCSVDQCEKDEWLREYYSFQSYSFGQIQRSWRLPWIYLSYSSSLNGKSLSNDVWIKETKHVKVPEPNPGDWYLLLVVNYLILPTLPPLCQILLVTQDFPRMFASLVWVWVW